MMMANTGNQLPVCSRSSAATGAPRIEPIPEPMSEMDHAYAEEHDVAGAYLAGRLSDGERAAFEAHYFACDACLERLEAEGSIFQSTSDTDSPRAFSR